MEFAFLAKRFGWTTLGCVAFLSGCSGGSGGVDTTVPGSGVGQSFALLSVKWGRLVDVYDQDNSFFGKQVIHESTTDGPQYTLTTNALTGHSDLKILNFSKTDAGFVGILQSISNALETTTVKGPADTFGFSMIPRNAGIRLQFSKEITPSTLNPNTVKVRTGAPPTTPFDVGTLELDLLDPSAVLLSAVVLGPENAELGINLNPTGFPPSANDVDATMRISFPNQETPLTGQNEILRDIEGKPLVAAGNPVDLTNGEIARLFRSGGSFDPTAGFLLDSDLPRILGSQLVTIVSVSAVSGEPNQFDIRYSYNVSFCDSLVPVVSDVILQGASYGTVVQVLAPVSGDPVVRVEVISGSFATGGASYKTFFDESVHVGMEPCFVSISPSATIGGTPGSYTLTLNENAVFTVEFSEPVNSATVLPFRTMVLTNRDNGASPSTRDITLPPLVGGNLVGYTWENFVVGAMNASADLKSFQLTPLLSLANKTYDLHVVQGPLGVKDFAGNPLDVSAHFVLSNMGVSSPTAQTESRTLRFKSSNMNEDGDGANVSEANAAAGGASHCQFSTDADGGVTGRSAAPYGRIVDDTQTFVSKMNVTQSGLQTPLVPLGAKMKTLWRYHDVFGGQIPSGEGGGPGPSVMDKETWHVNVVGLNWAPFGGNVFPDTFGRFKILLGHVPYSPIARVEAAGNTTSIVAQTGFNTGHAGAGGGAPQWGNPKRRFDANALETASFVNIGTGNNIGNVGMGQPEMAVAYDGPYSIQPANKFQSGAHTYMPYPAFAGSFIWRNLTYVENSGTHLGIPYLGGGTSANEFADSLEFQKAQLVPNQVWKLNPGWPSRSLPSIALPLCMEFRCFNNLETGVTAGGLNSFATSFMFNTNQDGVVPGPMYEVRPSTRMFSQGYNPISGGGAVLIRPESSETSAIEPKGGYCPANCPPSGQAPATTIAGIDPVIYWGRVELQNVVSVFFSSWVDTAVSAPVYGGFVIEPAKSDLPPGTDVIVEFRGYTPGPTNPATNARLLDPYGNCDGHIPGTGGLNTNGNYPCTGSVQPTAANGLTAWSTDIDSIQGKRFYQMRVQLVANATTNIVPTLKGIGVCWK